MIFLSACSLEGPVNAAPAPQAGTTAQTQAGIGGQSVDPNAGSGGSPATNNVLNPELVFASGCAVATERSSLLPSNLLLVVDRSGSMNCNPPPTTSSEQCEVDQKRADRTMPSKYDLIVTALTQAIGQLDETSAVGVSYFNNDGGCGVSALPTVTVAKLTQGQQAVVKTSLASITPEGATPLVGATLLAYQYLHNAALNGEITGNRYAVLITDGEQSESCSVDQYCKTAQECSDLLIERAGVAAGPGVNIRTFVIGVPGSENNRTMLSKLAQVGGTARPGCTIEQGNCHFDVSSEPDLEIALLDALQRITRQTLSCELDLPRPAGGGMADPAFVNVVFSPHSSRAYVIPQDRSQPCNAGANGWQYDSTQQQIRLCGTACTSVRSDLGGQIDVVLGCPSVVPE